jgi:PAS domain S-box-containing protein
MAHETILIVEDDGILAAFLQDTLTAFGYTALQPVATGEEAIAKAAEQKPQLVLMDIELAGEMNGITAAEHIQSASDTPIIYLSGYSQYSLLQKAKVVAPYGYLVKPVPVEELAAMIEMALYKHILDRRVRESEERFRTIYENAPILIDGFDKNGRCILWNKECEKTFGYTMEEVNSHDGPLSLFYPDQDVREEVMESVTSKPERIFRERHPITKDGKEVVTFWANFQLPDGTVMNIGYDITARKRAEEEREILIQKLQEALEKVKTLSGFLPICAYCKKIRDDKGYWEEVEAYIRDHSEAKFTHSICPECKKKLLSGEFE